MTKSLFDTLADVSNSLAFLAVQVRMEARAGMTSRNKVAENVLLPILQRIYAAPTLNNVNVHTSNFPGIDLFDPATGLGVQVTSDSSVRKITETVETIAAGTLPVQHLVITVIADDVPNFQARTRAKWTAATNGRFAFDATTDVLPFDRLFARIQQLPPNQIAEIAADLRALIRGTRGVDLLPRLRGQVEEQLANERRIARYIPDIFVETHNTKYHARCFAHPALFVRRVAEWFERQPLAGLNRLAIMSGVPPVVGPAAHVRIAVASLQQASETAKSLTSDLDGLDSTLGAYSRIGRSEGAPVSRDLSRDYVFKETRYDIEMGASGLQYRISQRRTELACVSARIFLLVGRAGQGKTNFLCDFVERFLLRHEIPCAYLTARQLSRIPAPDLSEVVRQLLFPAAVLSLDEGLESLQSVCAERRQPFVLLIDGLNEHPDVRLFAGQLEHLLEVLVRHPHVRVLMTCRSEFLTQRFGTLLNGRLNPEIHLSEAHGHRLEDEQYEAMVERYFDFFEVRPDLVSPRVVEVLRQDLLLLRFFCEAYGARDNGPDYRQPRVQGVYRDEIFRAYVEKKLEHGNETVANDRSARRPLLRPAGLRRVLVLVAEHMITTGRFADVPRDVVPTDLDVELFALLDEELVLRRDVGAPASVLSDPGEVLNFTFDELRDYLLAQYLLDMYTKDHARFAATLESLHPAAVQSTEGLQRFLFYASRAPANTDFFRAYREHPWYTAVYDTEVFNIMPSYLHPDDRGAAMVALQAGGKRARHFALHLSVRWRSGDYPVLNLQALVEFAQAAPDAFFDDVVEPAFGAVSFGREMSLGDEFCHFVEMKILPDFTPARHDEVRWLFSLLLLLLPIDATPTLDSRAVATFRRLAAEHPAYAGELLREALPGRVGWNRAFIWRLLGDIAPRIADVAPLMTSAQAIVSADAEEAAVRREAERFLGHVAAGRTR